MDFSQIFSLIKKAFISGAFDFLCEQDEQSVAPVALLLNLPPKTIACICNVLPPLFKGELALKDALPKLLPIFISFLLNKNRTFEADKNFTSGIDKSENIEKPTYTDTFTQKETANEEIFSFADSDIYYSINSYLESESAS